MRGAVAKKFQIECNDGCNTYFLDLVDVFKFSEIVVVGVYCSEKRLAAPSPPICR